MWKRIRAWLKVVGPLVGLIGGLVGGISLYDRWLPPGLEVLACLPVFLHSSPTRGEAGPMQGATERGVGFILHVQAGGRPVTVHELAVRGERGLSLSEYAAYFGVDGQPLQDLAHQLASDEAHFSVSFNGWLDEPNNPVRLQAYEKALIRFVLVQPTSLTHGKLIEADLVGTKSQRATRVRQHPEWDDFFEQGPRADLPGALREEFAVGAMRVELTYGSSSEVVEPSKLLDRKSFSLREWSTEPTEKLFYGAHF